jgi:alpha-beta hydrolase superfamily lysophospholipase
MSTYALVHGASHAAWHWHLVEDELRNRGHQVVAVDLPCDDHKAGATQRDLPFREISSWSTSSPDGPEF